MSKYKESNIEITQNLSISCSSVPDALLDKVVAKNYFQQYGKVLRIRLRPKHKMVIVEFANEESAQTAYAEIGEFQGQDFVVSWTKSKSNDKPKVRKKMDDPNWSDDPDIKNELEAMKGNFNVNKNYNLRPEGMVVDVPQNIPKKKLVSKARQWKGDKSTKTKNTESMSDQETELLKTIMTAASTNEEKFRILDARDKLIRSRTVRQSELARAVRTIGTCPDMCPEKERLMREVQHQVAAYEQLAGSAHKNTMNHKLAVKQYSRSSADQESPLAHELRPVDVLHLTMGYLLHRILDLCETCEVNLAEWYHFVWDRTRGIRKDVTQQELCCEKSVHLVEQCARFHVHCAARLVAEDVSVFDDKINTENLTKCLQTLKYMYHDLTVKHGIICKNEAEFRAYIVLLNLNDGNFMWEVQQLSPAIQRSHEIRFALNVYSALDKNNYVRFFKLIKSTSYLNACILLRYFNQVRFRALHTIIKSYSPRLPYPVVDLRKMLAFEDTSATITFLEYHGLQLNDEKSHVLLDRNRFRQPDTPFALDRAINVVESKRNTSVGEIVCGEPLPPKNFENHIPHDSFDDRGYLKLSELPKDFQNKYQQFLGQFAEPQTLTHHLQPPGQQTQNTCDKTPEEPKKSFATPPKLDNTQKPPNNTHKPPNNTQKPGGFAFKLQTDPTTLTDIPEKIQEISELDGEIQSFFGSLKNTLKHPVKNTFENTVKKPPKNESPLMTTKSETSRSQSPLLQQNENTSSTTNNFWGTSTPAFNKNIFGNTDSGPTPPLPKTPFKQTPSNPEQILKEKLIETQKLLEEKLRKKKLLEDQKKQKEDRARLLQQEKQNKLKEQEQLKQKKESERKNEALAIYEKELKRQIEFVAEEVLREVQETQIKNRLQEIAENIKMRKVLQYGRRWRNLTKISKKKRKNFFDNPVWVSTRTVQQQADELFTSSQNLTLHDIKRYKCGTPNSISVKHKHLIEKLDVYRIVWKILFEQLTPSESLNFNIFWKIGLSIPEMNNEGLVTLLEGCLDLNPMMLKKYKCNNGGSLSLCIKTIHQNEILNGLIYFNIEPEITPTNQEKFQKLVENKHKNLPFPIVVLIKSKFEHATIVQQLHLKDLMNNQKISAYTIFQYTENKFDQVLTKTLQFLAKHFREHPNKLESHELATILRNCLGQEFWHRIRSSMELNKRFSILLQNPNNVIDLYNEALKFCWNILFDARNYDVPSFPPEFRTLVDTSILLPCSYEYFPDYWKSPSYLTKLKKIIKAFRLPKFNETSMDPHNFQEIIEKYCHKIFPEGGTNIRYKILSVIYGKHGLVEVLPWVDVIELIILEKINQAQFNDKKHPIYTLVYDLDEMRDYRRIPWWFQLKFIQRGIRQIKYVEEFAEPEIIMDVEDDDIDLSKTLDDICINDQDKKIIGEYDQLNYLLDDLEKSMEIQKCIMKKFEERARMALDA